MSGRPAAALDCLCSIVISVLDARCCVREAVRAMRFYILPLSAALLTLAACGPGKPEEVDTRAPDPQASELANAAPVELPPAVKASVTFRCKDNSLIYVDFFQGDTQANLKTAPDATPVHLTASAAGEPLTAEGYSVAGTPKSITVTLPGKGAQTCSA